MASPQNIQMLQSALESAPPYVQDMVRSGKFESFMANLQTRMNIHADIADKVSNEILFTLLGMTEPAELPENLRKEAGVTDDLISPIIEETNRSIFVPLREELKKNPVALQRPEVKPVAPAQPQWVQVSAPPPPQRSLTPPAPLAQTPIYTPPAPAPSVSAFNQPAPAPNAFVPQAPANVVLPGAPAIPAPAPTPLKPQPNFQSQPIERMQNPVPQAPAPRPEPVTAQVAQPLPPPMMARPIPPTPAPVRMPGEETIAMVRTMGTDMEAMRRGEQPAPHVMAIPQPAPSSQPQWAPPAPQVQSAQWTAPPPAPTPAPQMQAPVAQPKPQYIRPYIPPTPRVAPRPAPSVPGSSDPYREPIE